MIVDTSALVAVLKAETASDGLLQALSDEAGWIPAPVLVELRRVTRLAGNQADPDVSALLTQLLAGSTRVLPFDAAAAEAATTANQLYGSGNRQGGRLNLLDLMVYGAAKVAALPILCTGNDFAATDALIHPASRVG